MLRKRNRSFQRDQKMGAASSEPHFITDILNKKHDYNSFLKVPGLFVGFNTKYSESDSVRSPTSPLDFRILSNRGAVPIRHPMSENDGGKKSWDGGDKVGLRIVDSLDHGGDKTSGSVNMFSDNKNICFGRQMNVSVLPSATKPSDHVQKSASDVVFEIGEVADETIPVWFGFGSLVEAGFICCIPASEIELSEHYTCVRTHGPNPKVTHIFGDYIIYDPMINCSEDGGASVTSESDALSSRVLAPYRLDEFLKFCDACNKKLDGEDIYMYRGEKGYCSASCRAEAMESDEDTENTIDAPNQ